MRLPALTAQLLSRKVAELGGKGAFDAWGIHRRAVKLQEEGREVLLLTIGSPDTPTPAAAVEAAVKALRNTDTPALWCVPRSAALELLADVRRRNYCPALGLPSLRRALAAGVDVPADRLAVVPGAQAGLFTSLKLLLGLEGGEVLVPVPCYSTYEQTILATGGTPVFVQPAAGDNFALRPAALAAAITPATRGLLITSPNNPTGRVLSQEVLEELGELCSKRGLWCISDETYTHITFEGVPHVSASSVPLLADRTIVIGSLSKALLRPGWRLGWLVAPPALMPAVEALAEAQHFGLSPFLQTAAAEMLSPPGALRALAAAETARYAGRRDALLEGLGGGALAVPLHPHGGMFVMVDVRAAGVSSLEFAETLLERHGVATLPGEGFGGGAALGHLRVALLASEGQLREAGRAIAACAAELGERTCAPAANDAPPLAAPLPASSLHGATALFAVRLDGSGDGWRREMLAGLRAEAGEGAEVLEWVEGQPPPHEARLQACSAAFVWDPPPGLLPQLLPALRLVVGLGAGTDHCAAQLAELRGAGGGGEKVTLARTVDPLAAERLGNYVLWAALHCSRRMEEFGTAQAARVWDCRPQERAADPAGFRVGVMGLGPMGGAAAAALARNGFPVVAWRRGDAGAAGRPPPAGLEAVYEGEAGLAPFLSSLSLLVVVLPLSPDTRGMLGAAQLALLPPGAQLLNVGRAEVVDESALLAALDSGRLGGAMLDVAPQEPLPAASPLWAHPRVRLTPHVAGHSSGGGGARQAVDSWRAALEGRRPAHIVEDIV